MENLEEIRKDFVDRFLLLTENLNDDLRGYLCEDHSRL